MVINLELPDDVEQDMEGMDKAALHRKIMEIAAVEAYRQRRIGTAGVRRMLGFEDRWETIEFLSTHKAYPNYDLEDLEQDRASIARVEGKVAQ